MAAWRDAVWGLALGVILAFGGAAVAGDSRVPMPHVKSAQGERCVEDTAYMRRNHMELLKHQRDATVHQGIRGTRHSLQACVDCHASKDTGRVLGSPDAFCQGCHAYAAVELDCFQCHSSKASGKPVHAGGSAK